MAATSPSNLLSADSLSRLILASLPDAPSAADAAATSPPPPPPLTHAFDAIALAANASMLAAGFSLLSLGDSALLPTPSTADTPQKFPAEAWSAAEERKVHDFRYAHVDDGEAKVMVKITEMDGLAMVMAKPLGSARRGSGVATVEVPVEEYVEAEKLPFRRVGVDKEDGEKAEEEQGKEEEGSKEEEDRKRLEEVYITGGRLSDLGNLMRVKILQKLFGSMQKGVYEEKEEVESATAGAANSDVLQRGMYRGPEAEPRSNPLRVEDPPHAMPRPFGDPALFPDTGSKPLPEPIPRFSDDHRAGREGPFRRGDPVLYGERDLYPAGFNPKEGIRGGIGPLPDFRPGIGGGGSWMGLDDPLLQHQGQGRRGYNPQAPPGARHDFPYGPGPGDHPRGAGMGGRPPFGPSGPGGFNGFGGGDFI